jgi:hypothetical protein
MKDLIDLMLKMHRKVIVLKAVGGLSQQFEVGMESLVQLIECQTVKGGGNKYNYWQTWVKDMSPNDQKAILGAWHGDQVGFFRVVGIYKGEPGLDMIMKGQTK